jgi:hypothetical protein
MRCHHEKVGQLRFSHRSWDQGVGTDMLTRLALPWVCQGHQQPRKQLHSSQSDSCPAECGVDTSWKSLVPCRTVWHSAMNITTQMFGDVWCTS